LLKKVLYILEDILTERSRRDGEAGNEMEHMVEKEGICTSVACNASHAVR